MGVWFDRVAGVLARWRGGRVHSDGSLPAVLVVGRSESASQAASPDWRVLTARTLDEAEAVTSAQEVALALCDRETAGADWRRAVAALSQSPSRPCVILLTAAEDNRLWDQVTAAGGYDVLRKPATGETLARAIRAGIAQWRSARALEAAGRRAIR